MNIGGLYADVGDHEQIAITKDLFLLIIQEGFWRRACLHQASQESIAYTVCLCWIMEVEKDIMREEYITLHSSGTSILNLPGQSCAEAYGRAGVLSQPALLSQAMCLGIAELHWDQVVVNYFTSSDPRRDIILLHICHKF